MVDFTSNEKQPCKYNSIDVWVVNRLNIGRWNDYLAKNARMGDRMVLTTIPLKIEYKSCYLIFLSRQQFYNWH